MSKNAQAKSFIKLQLIKIDWQNKVWFTKFMPLYDLIYVIKDRKDINQRFY